MTQKQSDSKKEKLVTAQLRKALRENPPRKPAVYSKKGLPFHELSYEQQVDLLKRVKAKNARARRAKAEFKRKARAPE